MKKQIFPVIDHGIDIIGDEWDEESESEEINTDTLQNKEDWEYEKRDDPDHPYCTNWPLNKKRKK
tara:strand:+ start:412 stop:606 length:195 start_codon:yes stop_codon:yes gene_type:complete